MKIIAYYKSFCLGRKEAFIIYIHKHFFEVRLKDFKTLNIGNHLE